MKDTAGDFRSQRYRKSSATQAVARGGTGENATDSQHDSNNEERLIHIAKYPRNNSGFIQNESIVGISASIVEISASFV